MRHAYFHIPFCRNICSYCDFCKILYELNQTSEYLTALEAEVKDYYNNETLTSIYVGGGTPSVLSPAELQRLFKIINQLKRTSDCEITFECNPEDITEVLIDILKLNGVNRLSIGIQSFNSEKLKFMERQAEFENLKNKILMIRNKRINNINLDLMYGIPGESFDVLRHDLKMLLKLEPEHISPYSLIIEDYTKIKINGVAPLDEALEAKMYTYISKKLRKSGYRHYEISNYAKPGYESRHNLAYWENKEYYGFGLGAAGYLNGFRYENTKSLNDYSAGKYRLTQALVSKQEMMEYEVMLGLRKIEGISLQKFFDKYEINLQDVFPIKPLVRNKDLIYKDGYVYLNPEKIYLMNEILMKLL